VVPVRGSRVPLFLHLALVLLAGLWLPPALVRWFEHVARLLG
jgi:hydrogenase-4 component F